MIDPISVGLALTVKILSDSVTSSDGLAHSALTGILGNRSDFLLVNGFKKVKEIITSKNQDFPENHDLLKTLRRSMLSATDMIRLSMKEDGEQKKFRKELNNWIEEQLKILPKLNEWGNWQNPASDELELFFTNEKEFFDKKDSLILSMTKSWENYLENELEITLPIEFIEKLNKGWYENKKLLTWHEATMALMIEALRNVKDDLGQRASRAFEHNFLSDIKLQLADIQEQMLLQIPNSDLINNLVTSQQKTIESQQETIEIQEKSNLIINETVLNLTNLLINSEKEKAILSERLKSSSESELKQKYNKLAKETDEIRLQLFSIYQIFPANFKNQLAEIENTKTIEQLSIEADEQMEVRKQMENEEIKRNALLKVQLGEQYETTYNFTNALLSYHKAITLSPNLIEPYLNLGRLYHTLGQYQDASKTFLSIFGKHEYIKSNYKDLSKVWDSLGKTQIELKEFQNAVESFTVAGDLLEMYREEVLELKVDNPDNITESFRKNPEETTNYYVTNLGLQNNIGVAYQKIGNIDMSKKYLLECLDKSKMIFGGDSMKVATIYNNLGDLLKLEDIKKSKEFFEQAHDIYKKNKISEHINLPILLDNLSILNLDLGVIEEALNYANESLKIRESIFGEKSFHTAKSYLLIGRINIALEQKDKIGRYETIINHLETSCEIFEGVAIDGKILLTTERKNGIIDSYLEIGYYHMDNYEWDKAVNYLEIPKNIISLEHGSKNVFVARLLSEIGRCKLETADKDKEKLKFALKLYEEALEIIKFNNGHPQDIDILAKAIDQINNTLRTLD